MRGFAWIGLAIGLATAPVVAQAQVSPNGPPPPGVGAGQVQTLFEADGVIFEDVADGGIRHKVTGFVCPKALLGFERTRLIVFDAAGGGRDVACNFGRGESWFTVYLTRLPGRTGESVFETYVLQAQNAAPSTGEVTAPLAPGFPPLPAFGQFWASREGFVDGLWMSQIGDWHIKLRVTYAVADEPDVRAFAEALYRQVHAQIAAPEI